MTAATAGLTAATGTPTATAAPPAVAAGIAAAVSGENAGPTAAAPTGMPFARLTLR